MPKLLITGGSSKIVFPLVQKLKKKFKKIYILTKKSSINYEDKKIKNIKFNLYTSCNLKLGVDIVIHLASLVPYNNKIISNDDHLLEKNLKITENLLKYVVKNKVKKVLYISSTDVYPLANKKKIGHSTIENCHNDYGLSKLVSEKLVKTYSEIYNISVIILRLGPLYSEEDTNCNKISKILDNIKKNKKIIVYNPKNVLSLLNVKAAAEAIVYSIKFKKGTFLITGLPLNLEDFVNFAKKKYHSKSKIFFKDNKLQKKIKIILKSNNQNKNFLWKPKKKEMFNYLLYEKK
jgi:nucleoside-diphosphate-sugar epimerase